MWLPIFVDGIRVLVRSRPVRHAGDGVAALMKIKRKLRLAMGRSSVGCHAMLLTYGSMEPDLPTKFESLHVGLPNSLPMPKVLRLLEAQLPDGQALVNKPRKTLQQLSGTASRRFKLNLGAR